ncbi:unnamed protein product [Clonostachys chloroleuca]|uniref:Uncharacterized protein n=1 Tax=Clonostachys chloroleuca TaxID=1926264 RepID=A0AA35LTU2_9HYPO|nr:unnamed protein product [Clonostachys chloroleuca]
MGSRLAIAATARGLSVRGLGRDVSKVPEGVNLESFVTSIPNHDIPVIEKTEGKGSVFRFRSGAVTLDELAPAYHKATGTQAKGVQAGSAEDIAHEVQAAREEKGLAGYWDYTVQAVALKVSRGAWDIPADQVTNLDSSKKPTAPEEYLRR